MGPNAKELFRLVEDFVDVIGFRMKDLRDAYQVTDNLGKPIPRSPDPQASPGTPGRGPPASDSGQVCRNFRTPGPGSRITYEFSGAQT